MLTWWHQGRPAPDVCRLAAELETEEPMEQVSPEGRQQGEGQAVPVNEEVLERLKGMEQQVQMALQELKKRDQQLAKEKITIARCKVGGW